MMILVDTSVWIDLLGKRPKCKMDAGALEQVATCPIIIQEVLQGIRDDHAYSVIKESLLALPTYGSPSEIALFLSAADLYRRGRKRGLTIRSSVDCLIAATAIQHGLKVWHRDRDFREIAKFASLEVMNSSVLKIS